MIGPARARPPTDLDDDALEAALKVELAAGASTRDAAAAVAGRLGVPRRRAYALAVVSRRQAARG